MRPIVLRVAVLLGVGAAACHRYEYRTIDCGPEVPPPGASALAWQRSAPAPGGGPSALAVRVVAAASGAALPAGSVRVRVDGSAWTPPGADGVVRFATPSPGLHEVTVRALGYHTARTTVTAVADSGVQVLAGMAEARTTINEACGFMRERVRRPWWKF